MIEKKGTRFIFEVIGLVLGVILLIRSINYDSSNELFSSAAWIIPSICLVVSFCEAGESKRGNRKIIKLLIFLGNISFELFLVHQLVIRYITTFANHFGFYTPWLAIVAFVISVLSSTIYKRIEQEFRSHRRVSISSERK